MLFHVYAKHDMNIESFDDIILLLKQNNDIVDITVENRRSFHDYQKLIDSIDINDVVIVRDLEDLGSNTVDVVNRIDWFIQKSVILVIVAIDSTYAYGIGQPMNKAILSTLVQSLTLPGSNIVSFSGKKPVGRSKIAFPDNWDDLYERWENKKISSQEFIDLSGLKKATFYNMLTEYKELQRLNDDYIQRFKHA